MDPKNLLEQLTQILRDTNPALVHYLSKMESIVLEDTIYIALPGIISKQDLEVLTRAIENLPSSATEGLKVKTLYKFNQKFEDKITQAVISEALHEISEKSNGELNLIPSKVAYFVIIGAELLEEEREACRASLQLFGSDSKFHRVIVAWGPEDYEMIEFEGGQRAEAPQQQIKPDTSKLTKISELNDPARQRTRAILQDDIMDLQILLGQSTDVLDVIKGLDTLGVSNGD